MTLTTISKSCAGSARLTTTSTVPSHARLSCSPRVIPAGTSSCTMESLDHPSPSRSCRSIGPPRDFLIASARCSPLGRHSLEPRAQCRPSVGANGRRGASPGGGSPWARCTGATGAPRASNSPFACTQSPFTLSLTSRRDQLGPERCWQVLEAVLRHGAAGGATGGGEPGARRVRLAAGARSRVPCCRDGREP